MECFLFFVVPPPGIEPGFIPSQGSVLSIERREQFKDSTTKSLKTQVLHHFMWGWFTHFFFFNEFTKKIGYIIGAFVVNWNGDVG